MDQSNPYLTVIRLELDIRVFIKTIKTFTFQFQVYSKDGETKVGKITKQWSGLAREAFTDSDYFGITFPMDLDVKIKAVLLGACFLIVSINLSLRFVNNCVYNQT